MGISIRPSEFIEGVAVPVDRNLLWKECRFNIFDYTRKDGTVVATTTAAKIVYEDDEGNEYTQQYSAAGVDRFLPCKDGKGVYPASMSEEQFSKLPADEQAQYRLPKSSNFSVLMNAVINAGFPENRLTDITSLEGLYAHHIGIPEPKRAGLVRETVEGAREKVISVPDTIIRLPWEKSGKTAPAKSKATVAAEEEFTSDAESAALAMVTEMLADNDKVTRQQVATKAIRSKNQQVAKLVFSPRFNKVLEDAGLVLEGEEISAGA